MKNGSKKKHIKNQIIALRDQYLNYEDNILEVKEEVATDNKLYVEYKKPEESLYNKLIDKEKEKNVVKKEKKDNDNVKWNKKIIILFVIAILLFIASIIFIILISVKKNINFKSDLDKEYERENTLEDKFKEFSIEDVSLNSVNDYVKEQDDKITELSNTKEETNTKITSLTEQLSVSTENRDAKKKEYNAILQEIENASEFRVSGKVKTINQYSAGYPTGCESAALTILLNYYGVNVSLSDVASRLKKGDRPYYENGIRYGGNPYIEFVGQPTDAGSYGVYQDPIEDVANYYKPGIIDGTGMSFSDALNLVRQGRPVLVWTSMYLSPVYVNQTWIYKPTGETIYWRAQLHAIVIIGYTNSKVIVSETLTGKIAYYDKTRFETTYNGHDKRILYY